MSTKKKTASKRSVGTQVRNLRRRAEAQLLEKAPLSGLPASRAGIIRLVHELQVHQIELEMQNEELRLTRAKTETFLSGKLHEERIRVEALLAEYTDLYDYAPTGYLTINREGDIKQLNFACARLLGNERSRLLERRLALFVAADDRNTFNDFVRNVFEGEGTDRCEVILRQENARPVTVLIEGVCHVARQECRMVMFDVSEHKRSELTSRQLAAIVESSHDAIMSATPEGVVTSWNTAAERICGFTAEEIIGGPISAIAPPERRTEQRALFERIKHGETVEGFETMRARKGGQTFPVAMTIFPVKDANGVIAGISCILRDVTARKLIERQIVEIAERERRELGHELHDGLGQHLHALQFLSTLLQKDLKRERSPCGPAAGRLVTLLEEAASLTRDIAHGLQPVHPVPEGLMTALAKLVACTQALFRLDCTLECRSPVLIDSVSVATHLYRIAQEAVNNAALHARPKKIGIVLRANADRIVLSIKDDGRGILVPRRDGKEGLGLLVMQHRANMLGGALAIRRLSGGGTEVVCSVPVAADAGTEAVLAAGKP